MNFFQKLKTKFSRSTTKKEEELEKVIKKSSLNFIRRIIEARTQQKIKIAQILEELEELLINYDLSFSYVQKIIAAVSKEIKHKKEFDLKKIIAEKMFQTFTKEYQNRKLDLNSKPAIFLIVGVNGSGKTSSCAKLAFYLKNQGKKVLLIAADTFRAAAVEQLSILATKIGVDIFQDKQKDPAAVVFKGLNNENLSNYDVIIIDTAGRFHNKVNLVNELTKIKKVVTKKLEGAPQETFLVLDATIGQNNIIQAQTFKEAVQVSAIILTKLDGISRGGTIFSIQEHFNTSPMFVTIGEKPEDIIEFDLE